MAQIAIVAAVSIGVELGLGAISALLTPKLPRTPLLTEQVSTSQDGDPIAILYGTNRLSGKMIWSPGFTFTTKKSTVGSFLGIGGTTVTTYTYFASFAFVFSEGPGAISRIWGDSKLIYDKNPSASGDFPWQDFPAWNSQTTYNVGNVVSYNQQVWQAAVTNTGQYPQLHPVGTVYWTLLSDYAPWDPTLNYAPGDTIWYSGQIYVAVQGSFNLNPAASPNYWQPLNAYYPAPTIYSGDEAQGVDPLIQASEGVPNTPAFRGLCYAVWENFPLANFGNRIPNIRAECVSGVSAAASQAGIGVVQSNYDNQTYPNPGGGIPPGHMDVVFDQPNTEGDVLIAYCSDAGAPGTLVPAIHDDAGNTWTPLYNAAGLGIWVCSSCKGWGLNDSPSRNTVHFTNLMYSPEAQVMEIGPSYQEWSPEGYYATGQIIMYPYNGKLYQALRANGPGVSGVGRAFPGNSPNTWQPYTQPAIVFSDYVNNGSTSPATVSGGGYSPSVPILAGPWAMALFIFPGLFSDLPPLVITALVIGVGGAIAAGGSGSQPIPAGFSDLFPDSSPQFSSLHFGVETLWNAPQSQTLDAVVLDICLRAGMKSSDVDVSLLATSANLPLGNLVAGYALRQPAPAADALRVLAQAYLFDGVESGGKFRFIPRGGSTVLTIPENDLGLLEDMAKVKPEQVAQAHDLPQSVTVLFESVLLDYQQGKQYKGRSVRTKNSKNQRLLNFPIVLTDDFARQLADILLWLSWAEQNAYSINLAKMYYSLLDPTDLIQFVYEGITFRVRLTDSKIGLGLTFGFNSVLDDPRNYISAVAGAPNEGFQPALLQQVAPSAGVLLDIPLLKDADSNGVNTGFYAALANGQAGWPGGSLYQSFDDVEFNDILDVSPPPASIGTATTTLASPPSSPYSWDTVNSLTIRRGTMMALSSDTAANVLNGSNWILVGLEIIGFQNVVDNGDGTSTVSMLLRGIRGTDYASFTHGANEQVVALDGAVNRIQQPSSIINSPLFYRAVSAGQNPDAAIDVDFTDTGNDLRPYAPTAIGGQIDANGNATITWTRRTRIGGGWTGGVGSDTVPLVAPDLQLYDVEIYPNGLFNTGPLRTFTGLTTETCFYSIAQVHFDFGGITQTVIYVKVYQRSSVVGRGFPGRGSAPAAGPNPIPSPITYPGTGSTPSGPTTGTSNPNFSSYTVSDGSLTQPSSTDIHMAQAEANWLDGHQSVYTARDFTIPTPGSATTYYITIYDPGTTGDTPGMTNLPAYAETTQAKVGQPGYVFIGTIVAQPAGSGTQTGGGGSATASGTAITFDS